MTYMGKESNKVDIYIYIYITDSLCYTAEANDTQFFFNKKILRKKSP